MRIAVTLIAFVLANNAFGADDEKYKSKEGKYAVSFPAGKVTEKSSKTSGGLASDQSLIEVKGVTFEVIVLELTDDLKKIGAKELYDRGEKGALGGDKKSIFSVDFTFGADKLPSREIAVKNGDLMDRALMILKGNRFYIVTVRGPNNFNTSKQAYAFFDSFELTK